jgi:3-methyladenine DNA glycosylase/8-oxoguanine DNA glycosylase
MSRCLPAVSGSPRWDADGNPDLASAVPAGRFGGAGSVATWSRRSLDAQRCPGRAVAGLYDFRWTDDADVVLDNVPDLLGASDDDTGFVAVHDVVARGRRASRGLRLCASRRVWDMLVPAVLEQKVTNREAWRSWRELCWRFGTRAPGPAPDGMRVPPDSEQVRTIRDWEWHRAGIDGARRRTLIAAASVARSLERAVSLGGVEGQRLLREVPGIGAWTAAEIAQRAWGDPDAVSVGDFHLPTIVGTALTGRPVDDDGMLEALAPYAGHRHRAIRYLSAAGVSRPRFGPRMPVRDYRAM